MVTILSGVDIVGNIFCFRFGAFFVKFFLSFRFDDDGQLLSSAIVVVDDVLDMTIDSTVDGC